MLARADAPPSIFHTLSTCGFKLIRLYAAVRCVEENLTKDRDQERDGSATENGDVLRSGALPVVSQSLFSCSPLHAAAFIGDIARRGWKWARCIFKEKRNNYDPLGIIIDVYQAFYRSLSSSSP